MKMYILINKDNPKEFIISNNEHFADLCDWLLNDYENFTFITKEIELGKEVINNEKSV